MPIEQHAPIGVIGAMATEVALLKETMVRSGGCGTIHVGGLELYAGRVSDIPTIVAQCGVGMVNAAACTQALIDRFGVRAVINTGAAGSLSETVGIGELVIATDLVNHAMNATNFGYAPGQTPGSDTVAFPTDPALREAAFHVATDTGMRVHLGRVASGDRFVCDPDDRRRIAATFDARCCEMEGAAIAQVCHLNATPCVVVRVVSDNADGTMEIEYQRFEDQAARDCAAFVTRLIPELA